jgi:hypothetical protein
MSYDGRIEYGLLGDYDQLEDIDVIADGIDASLAALLAAGSGKRSGAVNGGKPRTDSEASGDNGGAVSILPASGARRQRGPAADMRAKRSRRSGTPRKRPPS